jgi:hypothetical protein
MVLSMKIQSFQEIRRDYPTQFLVLIDPEEVRLSEREIEVTGARYVQAYADGNEMLEASRDLKKKGLKVTMCTPNYQGRFVIEQVPSARVMGI